ncbi:MAG: hypothetical protein QF443_04215 [Dehalococcoidia bacterium]|nr:hypothetical protein [Dehalococcoidia bacterium]|tara:strand:- start:283 stop:1485 length:1203 start_codon:yes stop_codon:yes gene_type:complete
MVKKIVFFCFPPVIKHHYKRFGVEILKDNGFEVRVYDFSPIVFPALRKESTFIDQPTSKDYFLFHEKGEALQAIHELDSECFVVVTGFYQEETFEIYRALSKANLPYTFWGVNSNTVGIGKYDKSLLWLWKFIFKFKHFNLKKLKRLLYKPILAPVFGIRSPDVCILGGEKSLELNGTAALIGEKTELLWTHTHDYDTYLTDLHKKEVEENIAVFIEPSGPMFPWDELLPHENAAWTVERYYPSQCRFFDYVEKELGLEVIVAAHPKSNHADDHPEYYGKRRTIRNQILPLIKKSKLVMTHSSTALSFAVLEKKPILILTTAEFEENDIPTSREFKAIASSLGTIPINVDATPYSIDWGKKLLVNEDLYLSYEQLYLKKADSEKLNSWQILANRLKQSSY